MTNDITPSPRPDDSTTATAPAVPSRRRSRTLVITGASVLAALALAGGGIAVGAAIADDDEDDDRGTSSGPDGGTEAGDAARGTDDSDAERGRVPADFGTTSAADITGAVEAATGEADGDAVSAEALRDGGWEITFRTADGAETEARVAADGTVTVVSTEAPDGDGTPPLGVLDARTIDAVVAAALDEADGRVVDIDVDDDATSPYDVGVLTAEGSSVEVSLDEGFAVVGTDVD